MQITTIAAALVAALLAAPALAAPPANEDACNKLAFDLANKAAAKKLPDTDAIKLDELIGTLEKQCIDGNFAGAEATAKQVEAALAK